MKVNSLHVVKMIAINLVIKNGLNTTIFKFVMPSVRKVVIGLKHTLILNLKNEVYGFGENGSGQLGAKMNDQYYEFVRLPRFIMNNVEDIAAGYWHSVILTIDKKTYSSGRSNYGQLGNNKYSNQFEYVLFSKNVSSISTGTNQTFFLKSKE